MKQNFIMSEEEKLKTREWIDTIAGCPERMKGTSTGQVLEDSIASLGKMIRPWLLMSCASFGPLYEDKKEELHFLGALVELTHLSSLIHDDIIDDAPLRRGAASIQSKYGKDAAVYAGDFLIARMNYWEAKMGCNEASQILAHAVEEMCIGEIGQAMCRYRSDVTCKEYFENIKGKTASLFRAACKIGAITAGCSQEMVHVFERFGEHLGIMFQLRDDLIDFSSNGENDGKKTHKDFQDGIYTLPVLMAMRSKAALRELLPIMDENQHRELTSRELRKMECIVISHGGVKDTWDEIIRRANMCQDILDSFEHNDRLLPLKGLLELLTKI